MRYRRLIAALGATLSLVAPLAAQRSSSPGDIALAADSAKQRPLRWSMPDGPGTGPNAAIKTIDPAFPGHVVFRPADLAAVRRPLPILLWGNGGCRGDGASARLFLEEIASHGYLAIAPGAILTGPGTPVAADDTGMGRSTTADVLAGIDLAATANAAGAYKGRLDMSRVAVAGSSCGGLQALQAAADPRVKAVVALHTGFFADDARAPNTGVPAVKAQLKALHTAVLYILGGERDVAYPNGEDDFARIDHVPVMVASHPVGHLGTFNEANGGAEAQVTLRWLQWRLFEDRAAARMFVGRACGLCGDPAWTVQRKRFDEVR